MLGAEASETERMPAQIGRYRIVALLGTGSTGSVYHAVDEQLGREVAVKVLRPGSERLMQRLQREARAQARIEHDHVCRIIEVGEANGSTYITMQLIKGQSLKHLADQLTLTEKVEAVRQIALALAAAHRLGVIHRDVKPANIMIERGRDGIRAYLVDFGIARVSETQGLVEHGLIVGTPAFMAPEQLNDPISIDRRADLYSLGATLYAILAGNPPYSGSTPTEIMRKALHTSPTPLHLHDPSVPADLQEIVESCLAADPLSRYHSAGELAAALQRVLDVGGG